MKLDRLFALATFCVERLLNHKDGYLQHAVILLFNWCVAESYLQRLNQMLLLPLHKKKKKIRTIIEASASSIQ